MECTQENQKFVLHWNFGYYEDDDTYHGSFPEQMSFEGESIEDALSVGLENVIIIPSDDEAFVTQVIDKLYALSENYQIELIGSPSWESFQNINLDQLQSMFVKYLQDNSSMSNEELAALRGRLIKAFM